jgi:hypothetical protein
MMRNAPTVMLCTLLFAASAAGAHETLPPTWCADPQSNPIIVSSFSFNPLQLLQYSQLPRPGENCGIVDSWHWAKRMAHEYCASVSNASVPAMPFVDSPRTFNDEQQHHQLYRFEDGLAGACVVCPPPPPLPHPGD